VDDFGTGHSSLLSLLRLPFGELKIDQSFVRGLLIDPDSAKIVRAVLSLAASMGLHVVVEGIETEAVARRLAELGADTGQGYLFAPPLGVTAATGLLRGGSNAA
jgi:EAL domain-containing protein (putative c-di-GMP-specific phosphodiesterase class I)